jgi:hypothetical protein
MYVGQTGDDLHIRMSHHLRDAKKPRTKPDAKKQIMFGNPNNRQVQVYCASLPLFYNSIVRPEFNLHTFDKTERLLEESAMVHFFKPVINSK